MNLLHEPHHDGSPTYVDHEATTLGWNVQVRCRTSADDPVDAVWIRTTYDAEPTFHACAVVHRDEHSVWWEGTLPIHNPVTHYRFLLASGTSQRWLTGAGVIDHDGPDAFDFRITSHAAAPDWGRDGVVYQVFPDRFARSAVAGGRPTPHRAVPAEWDDEVVFEGSDPHTSLQL